MSKPPVVRVKQVDWVATTARWGVAILLVAIVLAVVIQALFGEMP